MTTLTGFIVSAAPLLALLLLMVIDHKSQQSYRCRICGGRTEEQRKERCRGVCA